VSRKASSAAIGLFVAVAVTLGLAALIFIGGGHLLRRDMQRYVVYFRGSVAGLQAGAPVTFKGVEIGEVKSVYVVLSSADAASVRIPVVIGLDPRKIGRPGDSGLPANLPPLGTIIDAGLRAQLATGSFVTNARYVALDVFPGSPKDLSGGESAPYPEIPTLPTALESAEAQVGQVIAKLSRVDIESTFRSAQHTLESVDRLTSAPELAQALGSLQRGAARFESTMANLDALTLSLRRLEGEAAPDVVAAAKNARRVTEGAARVADGAETLVTSARGLVEPAGPALFRLQQSLTEVAATSRSLRHLIELVDRDPGILIRGGNP